MHRRRNCVVSPFLAALGIVQDKAAEFFHRKLVETHALIASPEPEAFGFYLSAFVSAARSVTFVLQDERKAEYSEWFEPWRLTLAPEEKVLLVRFNDMRVAAIHQTGLNVTLALDTISAPEYFANVARQGVQLYLSNGPPGNPHPGYIQAKRVLPGSDNADALAECTQYLAILQRLVAAFSARYSAP